VARARRVEVDSSKVLLTEIEAINRYLLWKRYRMRERDGRESVPTFAEWLAQSRIEVLPPEWAQEAGERRLAFDVAD
jgi:hypothetical protein